MITQMMTVKHASKSITPRRSRTSRSLFRISNFEKSIDERSNLELIRFLSCMNYDSMDSDTRRKNYSTLDCLRRH